MPEEPVSTMFGNMKAFLIECRSIGGLSGSSVSAWPGMFRYIDGAVRGTGSNAQRTFRLIGLMHGHFGLPNSTDRERLNMGIAIVNTYDKILEVLNQPVFMAREREILERLQKENLPEADSEFAETPEAALIKEDFKGATPAVPPVARRDP